MTVREIQGHLAELYGAEVSPDLELKARGVNDILIAVVDGLKGFPEAIGSVYPLTVVQTCIVRLIRNSLAFVSWKDRKALLPAVKAIYRA